MSRRERPGEPGQPLVPIELQDSMFDFAEQSLKQYLKWAKDNVERYIMSDPHGHVAIRAEHITFLMYGFLAETGLKPSATQLVERIEDDRKIWTYEKKHPVDVYIQALIKQKDDEIHMLRNLLKEAQGEIRHLRTKT